MLITDESKGAADGKEYDELQAMVAVGDPLPEPPSAFWARFIAPQEIV